jgi:flagellar hook protein FlgE
MRLETSLNTGRESILTHGTAINTVANNLANTNTTGFKDTRLEFSDLVADGGNIRVAADRYQFLPWSESDFSARAFAARW